jgi:hypothetical protein
LNQDIKERESLAKPKILFEGNAAIGQKMGFESGSEVINNEA